MACGLATIASEHLTKKPSYRWLVKDGLNTVVPENSPDSIAERGLYARAKSPSQFLSSWVNARIICFILLKIGYFFTVTDGAPNTARFGRRCIGADRQNWADLQPLLLQPLLQPLLLLLQQELLGGSGTGR